MLYIFCSLFNLIRGLKYTDIRLKHYKEETDNIYDTTQHGIRGGLTSVLGHFHVKYKINK